MRKAKTKENPETRTNWPYEIFGQVYGTFFLYFRCQKRSTFEKETTRSEISLLPH
jgi:hypothetical protein